MPGPDGVRRTELAWWLALALVLVAAAIATPWLIDLWEGGRTSLQDRARAAPVAMLERQRALGEGSSVLIVVGAEDGTVAALAIATKPPDDAGLMVLVPPSLFALLPGYGEFAIAEALRFEGPGLVATTLENALGIRIDDLVHLDPGDLAGAVTGTIAITLPGSVLSADGSEVLAEAGTRQYTGPDVEVLMATRGDADGLVRLERQAAVWTGILDTLQANGATADRLVAGAARTAEAAGVLAAVASSEPQVTLIPVDQTAGAGAVEGFVLDGDGVRELLAGRLAHLALGSVPRPRAEVLNGNGRVLATRPVVEALVGSGFQVIRTDNAERFDIAETLVIAQGESNRASAERALAAIGLGALRLELSSPSGVVDVSIIVGLDVPAGEG